MTEKFFFVPLRKRRILEDKSTYTVSIIKGGILYIPSDTMHKYFGYDFVRLFVDTENRTVGILPVQTVSPGMKEARKLTKNKYGGAVISIGNVVKAFSINPPIQNIPIREYIDSTYGKLLYVKIQKTQHA